MTLVAYEGNCAVSSVPLQRFQSDLSTFNIVAHCKYSMSLQTPYYILMKHSVLVRGCVVSGINCHIDNDAGPSNSREKRSLQGVLQSGK
jgi:hypothetical protein